MDETPRNNKRGRLLPAASLCAAALLIASAGNAVAQVAQVVVLAPDQPVSAKSLYLRAGIVDTAAVSPRSAAELAGPAAKNKRFVIQLDGPMTPARRAQLADAGVKLGDYLPSNAYIAKLDTADPKKLAALPYVRWSSEFRSPWKIAPEIGQMKHSTVERQAMAKAGEVALVITFFADATPAETQNTVALVRGLNQGHVYSQAKMGGNTLVTVRVKLHDVPMLAANPGVQFIEEAPEITLRNDTNRWIVQSNVVNVTPLYDNGIRGEGQVVGILDGRIDSTHCSFIDAVNPIGPLHRKILAYNGPLGSDLHGTHVAGTAVGDSGDNTARRGVAYLGKLVYGPIPGFSEAGVVNALTQQHNQGARLHTNSWGNDGTTAYDSLARGFDVFARTFEDDLVMLAVTNTGSLKNPENAKNLLAVGASQDTPSQNNFCSGGAGPTADGRRKPEIFAPGCSTLSASAGTGCNITALTGTSMASPAVAGTAMLVRQYFVDGYYPSGLPVAVDSMIPSGALIKATLLNSAVDMTGIAGYPSNGEGWGRVIAGDALFFPQDTRKLAIVDVRNANGLSTGQSTTTTINVSGAAEKLKVTLVWTDVAGAAGAAFASVNDLDLEVVAPGGALYRGNVFSGGQSATGGAKDDRNNVEQVHLMTAPAGVWTVRVIGAGVNSGMQGYALVMTGDVATGLPCPADVNGDGSVNAGDLADLLAQWGGPGTADLNGDGVVNAADLADLLAAWGACP